MAQTIGKHEKAAGRAVEKKTRAPSIGAAGSEQRGDDRRFVRGLGSVSRRQLFNVGSWLRVLKNSEPKDFLQLSFL